MKYLIFLLISVTAFAATGDVLIKQKTASGSFREVAVPAVNNSLLGFGASGNVGRVSNISTLGIDELIINANVLPMPAGTIAMWTTTDIANKPINTLVCDGNNGTAAITAPTGATAIIVANPTHSAPAVTPEDGTYASVQTVTATGISGSTIYYTNNSTNPDRNSTVYTAPLTASTSAEYRFTQVTNPGILSPITTRIYTINPVVYLVNEGFEESDAAGADGSSTDGYDSALASVDVVTGTGATISPDATGMVGIDGSQALRIVNTAAGNIRKRYDLGSTKSSLWIKVKLRLTGVTSINRPLIEITNTAGTQSYGVGIAGSGMFARITNAGTTDSTRSWVNGVTLTLWIKWNSGGACGMYLTQGTTRPTNPDVVTDIFLEHTGSTIAAQYIVLGPSASTAATYDIESFQVSATEIP